MNEICLHFEVFPIYHKQTLWCCSAYGIAAQALTAVIRAYDGRGPPTTLTQIILDKLNLSSPDELIGYASSAYILSLYAIRFLVLIGLDKLV